MQEPSLNHSEQELPREESPPGHRQWPIVAASLALIGFSGWVAADSLVRWQSAEAEPIQCSLVQPGGHEFDLSTSLIPRNEVYRGGPPKDGIPALTRPGVTPAGDADYLQPQDRVIGVAIGGIPRAYPIKILNYHEVVNDLLGGQAIAVTYCPLCDSAVVFSRKVGDVTLEFGVSGLLYNSNVLLYDRQSKSKQESLWSQLQMRAVTGVAADMGTRLEALPAELTQWASWRARYPDTSVLTLETGHRRDYRRDLYGDYFSADLLMFPAQPLPPESGTLKLKEPVIGVTVKGRARAYPLSRLKRAIGQRGSLVDSLGDSRFRIMFDAGSDSARVDPIKGEPPAIAYSFWFAWHAMYPDTEMLGEPGAEQNTPTASAPASLNS